MSQEPELTQMPSHPAMPSGTAAPLAAPPASEKKIESTSQPQRHVPPRIPRWLERAELFLRVLLRLYIGLAVCYAPWSHLFWDQNPLFIQFPVIGEYASTGVVRGIISGLGLLNLWIAFRDAVRHRDG